MTQKLRVLAVFSNPPEFQTIRLDREDKLLRELMKKFDERVEIVRSHASDIEDIHQLLWERPFDVIHFSGHGDAGGLYLDQVDLSDEGDLVTPDRLRNLLAIAEKPPLATLLLACYSADAIPQLAEVSPFVISAVGAMDDELCIEFVRCFYERLFGGFGVTVAFDHARFALQSQGRDCSQFRLDRRQLIIRGQSTLVECRPDPRQSSILVNLDNVVCALDSFNMSRDELLYLLQKRLAIHYWIFAVPRERCIIPIGRMLFGEFSWSNVDDMVVCTRLLQLDPSTPREHWQVWHRLLISYNDLASSNYRTLESPASPANRVSLSEAVTLFTHHANKYVQPAIEIVEKLGFRDIALNLEFMSTHVSAAQDQLDLEQYPHVVQSLEQALTNYHDATEALTPPEQSLDRRAD